MFKLSEKKIQKNFKKVLTKLKFLNIIKVQTVKKDRKKIKKNLKKY